MNKRSLGLAVSVFGVAVLLGMALYSWVAPETAALAELSQIQGDRVERDFKEQPGTWSSARAGALFVEGDGMRTLASTSAILALADESELRVTPNTTLRFLLQKEGEQEILGIDVQSGEALIQVGRSALALRTHIGQATLVAGSLVSLIRDGEAITFAVKVGKLEFEDAAGRMRALESGETLRLGIGMAELTSVPDQEPQTETLSPELGEAETEARKRSNEPSADGTLAAAPDYFNISVKAGESFVLHAPELPVSAAIDVADRCPGEAEIEVLGAGQKTRGSKRINALLSTRSRGYTVRCLSDKGIPGRVVTRGSTRVLLDAGTRKLPPTPPSSLADADGRTYTVYYSNQPPAVRIRWPNAPSAGSYTLNVDGREQVISQAEHVFGSGDLRDGVHQVSFRAGTRGSRTTFIDVRFDNNAPTASVQAPSDRSFASGQAVHVDGVSLPAWKVSLEGGTMQSGSDGRFSGDIVPDASHPDVVVRLSHPRLGVHYYLRRAGTSP